jgi:alpha-N-arabinofuranosidase
MKTKFYLFTLFSLLAIFSQCSGPKSRDTLTINLSETREAISPYIYGQFIEHLGRCINGGIWAEMLEDRKFYYPVTDTYSPWSTRTDEYWNAGEFRILTASPWRRIGPAGCIRMNKSKPFTGQHAPDITLNPSLSAGISQEGLYLRSGLQYIGHIVLSGSGAGTKVKLAITSGDSLLINIIEIKDIPAEYKTYSFSFTPEKEIADATLRISGTGTGTLRIGTVSLMPGDNISGFNRKVIAYLKELNSPVYRWPGGNFVSGYNWRDGIGSRDRRPPRKNPAWTGVEPNDVGIHEFMELCSLIQAEPYVAVNTGLGTMEEVAQQVEYINGTATTPMGKWRAENGHPEPFGVKFWAVGNEMYGDWQLGHMPLSEYVKKHRLVAEAMKAVDPSIKLVGVGAVGEWSKTMLAKAGDRMDFLSEHIYCKELKDVKPHVNQIPDNIRRVAQEHRKYIDSIPGLKDKHIRIAMDEWNFWHGDYLYGELGCRYFWKDGLGIAAGLHEYFRNSDLFFMANYAQTVNVIGAIKTTKKDVEFETTGIILKLYREHFGQIPIITEGYTGTLDISVAEDTVNRLLTIAVINTDSVKQDFNLKFTGGKVAVVDSYYEVNNADPMSYNEPGKKRKLDIKKSQVTSMDYLEVKPFSVTLLKLKLKE